MQTTTERPILEQPSGVLTYTPGGRLPGHDEGYDLFEEGYRIVHWHVRPEYDEYAFEISRPKGKPGRATYVLRPLADECDCPATKRHCKHLRCLCDLVFLTAGEFSETGRRRDSIELLQAWGEFTTEQLRRQYAAQPQVRAERQQVAA